MSAMRMVFVTFFALILIGMYLTGFQTAHWFLYIPAAAAAFAGITGICPGPGVQRPGLQGTAAGQEYLARIRPGQPYRPRVSPARGALSF
jgi:hypothetical protein